MSMISISGVGVSFGGKPLFEGLSFVINQRDRIGLVGKNGVGKSTLLNVIFGSQPTEKGTVALSDGVTVGYLPQEIKFTSNESILNETMKAFAEVIQMNEEIEKINRELEIREDYQSESYTKLIESLTEKHERLHLLDSSKMESQVEKVLLGLGFERSDFVRPVSEFSGGWQMRVELAKLLLLRPSLLLLDEPTNHLDIESILWLEEFFQNYPGALLMISHDRMFLDNITNRTIEIVFGRIYDYKVPYSQYFVLREERYEQQMATYRNQQKHIEQQEKFIERFRAKATKAKQVQSKVKQLAKIDRVELDELDQSSIHFHFPPAPRSGDVVLRSRSLVKQYGDSVILKNLDFDVERGERLAFVGRNGEGKTTLVKLITGQEDFSGDLIIGHNVAVGYYAQVQENTLDPELSVYETIEAYATDEMAKINKIRGLLGAFLFGSEDVDKKVKVLSGGEKSRLALAKLLLKPVNLLILDEPTNHLDITAKNVLKQALLDYTGTLIVVSHDRDFLEGLTNRTFEFRNKGVREHLGEISEFLHKHEVESFRDFESTPSPKKAKAAPPVEKKMEAKAKAPAGEKGSYQDRKEREKAIRKLRSSISRFEKKIEQLEQEIASLEETMQAPDFYENETASKDAFFKHANLQKELDQVMTHWEEAQEQLDAQS